MSHRWLGPALGLAGAGVFAGIAWLAGSAPSFEELDRPVGALPATTLDGRRLAIPEDPPTAILVWMPG